MRAFACTAIISLATFGLVFGGATVDRSVVSVVGQPGTGGGCSSVCAVGASGTGGADGAGGNAQGFLRKGPGVSVPGTTIQNSGNDLSGHLVVKAAPRMAHSVVTMRPERELWDIRRETSVRRSPAVAPAPVWMTSGRPCSQRQVS